MLNLISTLSILFALGADSTLSPPSMLRLVTGTTTPQGVTAWDGSEGRVAILHPQEWADVTIGLQNASDASHSKISAPADWFERIQIHVLGGTQAVPIINEAGTPDFAISVQAIFDERRRPAETRLRERTPSRSTISPQIGVQAAVEIRFLAAGNYQVVAYIPPSEFAGTFLPGARQNGVFSDPTFFHVATPTALSVSLKTELLLQRALAVLETDPTAASIYIDQALALSANDGRVVRAKARALHRLGDAKAALVHYTRSTGLLRQQLLGAAGFDRENLEEDIRFVERTVEALRRGENYTGF